MPLAVGPPLLTLVNFEVENLAYMLVCMRWMVSGGSVQAPQGTPLWWRDVGHKGAAPSADADGCTRVCAHVPL